MGLSLLSIGIFAYWPTSKLALLPEAESMYTKGMSDVPYSIEGAPS
jgi:hypothetical protein